MFHVRTKNISDSLYTAMRMPGKTFDVMCRIIGPEIIQEQEWIKNRNFAEPKCPFEVDTGSLDRGFALQNLCLSFLFQSLYSPYYEINCYEINCYEINYYEIRILIFYFQGINKAFLKTFFSQVIVRNMVFHSFRFRCKKYEIDTILHSAARTF